MKKLIVLFLCIFLLIPSVYADAHAYVVMDASSGRVLLGKNMDEKNLIASTTKIMTALIALENAHLDMLIEAGEEVLTVYGSMLYLDVGECLTLKDLLYGLMYQSGNDAAMVIASNIMPYDKFIDEMNRKAVMLGMKNTVFENPHGLDDETKNYSTAYDMALLMRYATKNDVFMEITGQKKYVADSNIERHIWYNKNKLLSSYRYATSGKIGYTTNSKHVFASSAKKGEEEVVIATIKDTDRFNTHESLYEQVFNEYDKYMILNKYTFSLKEDYYNNYHLFIKNDFEVMLNDEEKDEIKLEIKLKKLQKVNNNDSVGYVEVYVKDELLHSEEIYAISEESKLEKIKNWLFFWK